jgi:DNA-binding NarL/FixJ family response regulator
VELQFDPISLEGKTYLFTAISDSTERIYTDDQDASLKHNNFGDKPATSILSEREFQVASMIVKGKPLKEISSDLGLSEKTISTYRTRILEKLKIKSNKV